MKVDVAAAVVSNTHLSPGFSVLVLDAPSIARNADPGQFVMVRTASGDGPLLRRPYSVFEVVRDDGGRPVGISLFVKCVGPGSQRLYDASPGQRFDCLGPLGRPFALVDPPCAAWLVAGGVGLAPMALLAESLHARGVRATLFYGARTAGELFCLDRFERLAMPLTLATEDGTRGVRGRVTVPLDRELRAAPKDSPITVYACGPEAMLQSVAALAGTHGLPSQLAMERLMACGMGGCYSCVVRVRDPEGGSHYARTCIDGPVFCGGEIIWE